LAAGCGSDDEDDTPAAEYQVLGGRLVWCAETLESLTVPDNASSIGNNAFNNCPALTKVTIPATVEKIGSGTFYGVAIREITYMSTMRAWDALARGSGIVSTLTDITVRCTDGIWRAGMYDWEITDGVLTRYCGDAADVKIPGNVTVIGEAAFEGRADITGVTIPSGVTAIGDGAFRDCAKLTDVTIPDGVIAIGENAFDGCDGLTSADIPASVETIGAGAIPAGTTVTYHGTKVQWETLAANAGLDGVTAFVIDGNGTLTGYCGSAADITLPDDVKGIAGGAFAGHEELKHVAIPAGVTAVAPGAFDRSGITEISFGGTVAEWGALVEAGGIAAEVADITVRCADGICTPVHRHDWGAYTDGGDGTHRRTCAGCGRTESAPHGYDGAPYERGDGGHYQTCTAAGCNAHSPVEAHQYGDEVCTDAEHSKTCSLCTYSMTAPHNWSGYTNADTNYHRRTCAPEGFTAHSERVAHTIRYDKGNDSTHTKTCTANCGYSETEAHTYGGETYTDTEHSKSCSLCTYSKTAPHSWSGYTDDKDGNHSRTCTVTGFKTHSETKAHDYGTTYSDNKDGTHYQTCAVCGGTSDPVSHGYEYKDNADGSHTKTCKAGCGYSKDIDHNWSGYTSDSTNYHSRTCAVEGFKTHSETEAHDWGANYTDNKDGKHYQTCSVCHGQSTAVAHTIRYNNGNDSNHTKTCTAGCGYSETEEHTWGSETCTDAGHSKSCTLCTYSASKQHDWSDYADDHDGSHHSRTCAIEGFKAHTETKAHDYGMTYTDNKDGKHYQTCSVCHGQSEAVAHDCKHKDNADGTHTTTCTKCAYSKTEEHRYKDDTCEDCGCPKPTTVYVASSGDDTNSGLTASKAVKTLSKAIELYDAYGLEKIMVCTGYTLPSGESTLLDRAGKNHLTLMRYDGSSDVSGALTDTLLLINSDSGDVTITNVTLDGNKTNVSANRCLLEIYNSKSTVTLGEGAAVCNNKSTYMAGGVSVWGESGTFEMVGGTITGNETTSIGGGVYVSAKFKMSGGVISGNTAPYGGGVLVNKGYYYFTMTGGKIINNTATTRGGGVYVNPKASFEMSGGEITGNNAPSSNGVYIDTEEGATFTNTGGTVQAD
ncbi:MAG: leucine-rich repeat domain-containing protein, partial [Treponema sp.]|nr:leucine-rich repeat domain-containing protein [Treponema sp.]